MMPNSDLKLLGEKVRTERKLAGLTQEQLANVAMFQQSILPTLKKVA